MKKIISLIGARPQFIKEAIVGNVVRQMNAWQHVVVNSGQHYDTNMAGIFFEELNMPEPEYTLGIGSGSHGAMTAKALEAMEKVLLKEKPHALLVYGDTNTTLAGALAAAKLHIPIVHVEAGIRMEPRTMPEEINRVLTDRIASVMCCCSALGQKNLINEGLTKNTHITGDVMYDLYCHIEKRFAPEKLCQQYGLKPENFVLTTIHRDYNVDTEENLHGVVEGLVAIQKELHLDIVWPIHPRARKMLHQYNLHSLTKSLQLVDPMGYVDLLSLAKACSFVITDSGGLQKEAYYAQKRSLVIMPDTGWRELTDMGWNILSAPHKQDMVPKAQTLQQDMPYIKHVYGDGQAAPYIVKTVLNFLT